MLVSIRQKIFNSGWALGHDVVFIPPQHSKPFVRGGKRDARDALGIAEPAGRPKLRPLPAKLHE